MKNNAKPPTKRERARIALILSLQCIYCTLAGDFRKRPLECHHIVRGNKRLGHWYTLQVCRGHHQGQYTDQAIRVGIHSGRHALKEAYGYDELELWQRQQVAIGLDDELPSTKILPRKQHANTELSSDVVEIPQAHPGDAVALPMGLEASVPPPAARGETASAEAGAGSEAAPGDRA